MRNYITNFTKFKRLNENNPERDFAPPAWLPGEEDNGEFSRHSDNKSTLGEKVANIFKDPSKPRPLVDIPMLKNASERQAVLSFIESHIESMGKSFDMKSFQNWAKYLQDVADKVKIGELAGHVSGARQKNPKVRDVFKDALKAYKEFRSTGKNSETAMAVEGFINQFRELRGDTLEPFDPSMLKTSDMPILVWYDSSKYPDDEVWSLIMNLNLGRQYGMGSIKAIPCPLGTSIGSAAATRFLHTKYQP